MIGKAHQLPFTGLKLSRVVTEMDTAGRFLREFIKSPAEVGSICPSSSVLAAALISPVPLGGEGLIIDLGAGSGPVSAELIRAGIQKDRIIAVEALKGFSSSFSRHCPGVPLIIADAGNLGVVLEQHAPDRKVDAIISSLPFRTMSAEVTAAILAEVRKVMLERGGILVQYSYAWWLRYPLKRHGLAPQRASLVIRNLPPARVEAYAGQR